MESETTSGLKDCKQACFSLLPIIVLCFFSLWLRLPFIYSGMPFFYSEDEAHHFNRVAEMTKSGDWDPHYFHKPSLHFYLRIPVTALAFLDSARKGHIKSLKELRTRDKYGLAGYAFTASHPGIVKWNRALSVLFSLLLIVFTYLIARHVNMSETSALLADAFHGQI